MNIFMKQETFLIDKIEKVADGWNIRVKEKNINPIHISNRYYNGKMPPKFHFPWHKSKLYVLRVDDIILSAKIDDFTLFTLEVKDYPEKVINLLKKGEETVKKTNARFIEEDNHVRETLTDYLTKIPINPDLEKEISKLHICLRCFLKQHLLKGGHSEKELRSLNLMYRLVKIAETMYYRHVEVSNKAYDFNIAFAEMEINIKTTLWVNHHLPPEEIVKRPEDKKFFGFYLEIDRLIDDLLPVAEDQMLKNYLNFVVRMVLNAFAADFATLQHFYAKDSWYNRIKTDEEDYRNNYQRMSLLRQASFILPRIFSDKEIKEFMQEYSLS